MALAKKQCRVCGKPYETCRTSAKNTGLFIWREVACSPECGQIYLEQIFASRNPISKEVVDNHSPDVDVAKEKAKTPKKRIESARVDPEIVQDSESPDTLSESETDGINHSADSSCWENAETDTGFGETE